VIAAVALLTIGASAPPAFAREVDGVMLPDSAAVGGKALTLNGMGTRKKLFVKVYVAGLYVERPSKDAQALATSDQMKRVRMVMVRDLGRDKIVDAIENGVKKNMPSQLGALRARLDQLFDVVPDLKRGDEISITYEPGKGTTLVSPRGQITLPGKDLGDALFSVWLGKEPADDNLRTALAGG
jgi:hypothetical protein